MTAIDSFARKVQRSFSKQFIRFVFVGVLNTALSYALYAVGLAIGFQYAVANLIALIAGILISFKAQGALVFNNSENRLFWRFLACWVLIYFVNIAFIREMMKIGFDAYQGGALALPFVVVLSFVLQKFLVFRRRVV